MNSTNEEPQMSEGLLQRGTLRRKKTSAVILVSLNDEPIEETENSSGNFKSEEKII